MPTLHIQQTTTVTPAQFVAALTDFGPGRNELFPNTADDYVKVHHRGDTDADVTEGSRGIWERLHYDWSDPNKVVLTTTDSNAWGRSSGHTYAFSQQPDGRTVVDVTVVREGKNIRGKFLGVLLSTVGRGTLATAFDTTVKAIEARNSGTPVQAEPGDPTALH